MHTTSGIRPEVSPLTNSAVKYEEKKLVSDAAEAVQGRRMALAFMQRSHSQHSDLPRTTLMNMQQWPASAGHAAAGSRCCGAQFESDTSSATYLH